MEGCLKEGRVGCWFSFVFKIVASMVTVKQSCRYGGGEAGVVTRENIPCRGTAVQRPCGRCVFEELFP